MKRLLSLASCSLVGRLDGSVCAKACVATPRTTAMHVTCVFVSMKVRNFILFSRPALRMVLNGALAVDWTVVHHAATRLVGTHGVTAPSPYSLSRPRAGPSSFSPPDTRGWRARGRCRRRFDRRISLRKCGSASRRATRTSLKCPGSFAVVFFRFAHGRKRNACAGPRFPGTVSTGVPDPRRPRVPTGIAVII